MATQDLIAGSKFRLMRKADAGNTFEFLCLATTINFERQKDFEDASLPDCDDPEAPVVRRSVPRSSSWSIKFSGKSDAVRLKKIEADFNGSATRQYQLLEALTAAQGGQTHTGDCWVESLTKAKSDNGMVTFDCTLRGDGVLVTAPVA